MECLNYLYGVTKRVVKSIFTLYLQYKKYDKNKRKYWKLNAIFFMIALKYLRYFFYPTTLKRSKSNNNKQRYLQSVTGTNMKAWAREC